ncbi:tetratricopeptide (TPR) repeat protein [Streptacidiphilus sp. MAP12-33]|uniref:hypothetical protein n=1 Tax=Streptacidiphilus sp. MAP12-33 TaxID=3156266 RepID=UPI003518FAE3
MGRLREWRATQRLASDLAAKALGTQPYFASGRYGEMLHPLRTWLAEAEAGLAPEHDVTLELRFRLAAALRATGAVAESGEQAALVVAARERLGSSQTLVQAWVLHADALDRVGRHDEAAEAWAGLTTLADSDDDRRALTRVSQARRAAALCHAERFGEAEAEVHQLLQSAAGTPGPAGAAVRLSALILLSAALTGQGRPVEAESAARQGLVVAASEGGSAPSAETDSHVLQVNLAAALTAQGRHHEALDVLAAAPVPAQVTAETAAATAIVEARALLALGRRDDAARTLRAALPAAEQFFGPDHTRLHELRALLARADGVVGHA